LIKANDLPQELPRDEIKTQAVQHALLNLIGAQIVAIRGGGRYGLAVGPSPVAPELQEVRQYMQQAASYILQLVVAGPDQYTLETLAEKVHRKIDKMTDEQFNQLIGEMIGQNAISIGKDKRISTGRSR
jgi:hypothetical protein